MNERVNRTDIIPPKKTTNVRELKPPVDKSQTPTSPTETVSSTFFAGLIHIAGDPKVINDVLEKIRLHKG